MCVCLSDSLINRVFFFFLKKGRFGYRDPDGMNTKRQFVDRLLEQGTERRHRRPVWARHHFLLSSPKVVAIILASSNLEGALAWSSSVKKGAGTFG